MKNGKAGGDSGILPEMVKAASCEEGFFHLLMDVVHAAWCECRVPKEWSDAVLVAISKMGDLGKCDNWRGIALFDVVESFMSSCRSWLKVHCLRHNVGLGRPEDGPTGSSLFANLLRSHGSIEQNFYHLH